MIRAIGLVVLTLFVGSLVGLVACGTRLSSASDAKLVNAERFAGFELTDCAVDAGRCNAAQIRQLATSIGCAVASVRADGKRGSADAGPTCAQAAP